jgi:hypothetical protein
MLSFINCLDGMISFNQMCFARVYMCMQCIKAVDDFIYIFFKKNVIRTEVDDSVVNEIHKYHEKC